MSGFQQVSIEPFVFSGKHTMQVPGDKSISQRAAIFSGLAHGRSELTGFLESEDCKNTLNAMIQMGASVRREDGVLRVQGIGNRPVAKHVELNLGNSGTGMRLLTGLISGMGVQAVLTGDSSLCSRPMRRIKEPLEKMGADISLTGEKETAPITVYAHPLRGIRYELPMASAQVKSAIMLAGLFADGEIEIIEPAASRDHTERFLKMLGIPLVIKDLSIRMEGFGVAGPPINGFKMKIPGDISSAAFFLVAAAVAPGVVLTVENLGLNPGRTALLDVLQRMGAEIDIDLYETGEGEPAGNVTVTGGPLRGTEIGGREIPLLIDEIPILAVAGAAADGTTRIVDAKELRYKESDRIKTMVLNLQKSGVNAEELEDGMIVHGTDCIPGGESLDCFGDHRIAMSMAVLALRGKKATEIKNVECVNTSYPEYWDDLRKLGVSIHE